MWRDDSPMPPWPGWRIGDPPPRSVIQRDRRRRELALCGRFWEAYCERNGVDILGRPLGHG